MSERTYKLGLIVALLATGVALTALGEKINGGWLIIIALGVIVLA
jgi:hypothetical protein